MKTKHPSIPLKMERQDLLNLSDSDSQQANQTTSRNVNSPSLAISTSSSVSAAPPLQNSITQYIYKPPPI